MIKMINSFLLGELLRVIGLQEVQTLEATAYVESRRKNNEKILTLCFIKSLSNNRKPANDVFDC